MFTKHQQWVLDKLTLVQEQKKINQERTELAEREKQLHKRYRELIANEPDDEMKFTTED
jgi:hypothetical protein